MYNDNWIRSDKLHSLVFKLYCPMLHGCPSMVIFPAMTNVGAVFFKFVLPVIPESDDDDKDDDDDDDEDDDCMVLGSDKGLTNDKKR